MQAKSLNRRAALELFGAVGTLVVGCGSSTNAGGSGTTASTGNGAGGGTSSATSSSTASTASGAACKTVPSETAGPYPDKSNMLGSAIYERQDISEGRPGVKLTVELTVQFAATCHAVTGATVMIWHCDADGHYSEYNQMGYDGTGQTFLRGYQKSGADGKVTFTTIYPGWYQGRATHIHIEVFVGGKSVKVTQMAFPEDVSAKVFAVAPYATKGNNTTSNAADMVFGDGDSDELAAMKGDTNAGFTASLALGIS